MKKVVWRLGLEKRNYMAIRSLARGVHVLQCLGKK